MNWSGIRGKLQRTFGLQLKLKSTPNCYICGRYIRHDWARALDDVGSMCISCHDSKYKSRRKRNE